MTTQQLPLSIALPTSLYDQRYGGRRRLQTAIIHSSSTATADEHYYCLVNGIIIAVSLLAPSWMSLLGIYSPWSGVSHPTPSKQGIATIMTPQNQDLGRACSFLFLPVHP
jgi:hypothetical protein